MTASADVKRAQFEPRHVATCSPQPDAMRKLLIDLVEIQVRDAGLPGLEWLG
jgi:hypothetical protein